MVEFSFSLVDDRLDTDWFVPVPDHVINMDFPISGDGSEGGAGVGSPGHVPHGGAEVVGVERLAEVGCY